MAAQPTTIDSHQLQRLVDSYEITDLVSRLGTHLDEKRPQDLRKIFTDDIRFYFEGTLVEGIEEVVKRGQVLAERFARIHHVITNILIDLEGESAEVRANLIATHVYWDDRAELHYESGNLYRFTTIRTPAGWRIARASLHNVWTNGSWDPPARP